MKQKHHRITFTNSSDMKRKHVKLKVSVAAFLVVAIAISTVVALQRYRTTTASNDTPPVGAAVPSQFSFTGATGWWQGATNETSMALFHRTQDGCFVSAQHKTGSIAADKAKLQKNDADLIKNGYKIASVGTKTLTVQTNSGKQKYELQQSAVATPKGADKIMGGQEFGYLQLSDGYLFFEGYCNSAAKLPATIAALEAVTFDFSKTK